MCDATRDEVTGYSVKCAVRAFILFFAYHRIHQQRTMQRGVTRRLKERESGITTHIPNIMTCQMICDVRWAQRCVKRRRRPADA